MFSPSITTPGYVGISAFVSVPGTPPTVSPGPVISLSFFSSLGTPCFVSSSGRYCSSSLIFLSKLIVHFAETLTFSSPYIFDKNSVTSFSVSASNCFSISSFSLIVFVCCISLLTTRLLPSVSIIATFSSFSPSTLFTTSCIIPPACDAESEYPLAKLSFTDADAAFTLLSHAKLFVFGKLIVTIASFIPSIVLIES